MYSNKKVVAVVQARMTSSRLKGKVLLSLAGKPVLQHIIERLRRSEYVDSVVVACTTNEADNAIVELCDSLECISYRGSEDDVLMRVLEAARENEAEIIVDITSDCPCVDWNLIDILIANLDENDYISNVMVRKFPRGLDAQVFFLETLERVDKEVDNKIDRQHVTSWIYKNPKNYGKYKTLNYTPSEFDYSHLRLTLDVEEDYQLLKFMFDAFDDNLFGFKDIIDLFTIYPELPLLNQHIEQKNYYKELVEAYAKQV